MITSTLTPSSDMPTNTHGGAREGAGRPETSGRSVRLSIRLTPEAADLLEHVPNKSAYIDQLIKRAKA